MAFQTGVAKVWVVMKEGWSEEDGLLSDLVEMEAGANHKAQEKQRAVP